MKHGIPTARRLAPVPSSKLLRSKAQECDQHASQVIGREATAIDARIVENRGIVSTDKREFQLAGPNRFLLVNLRCVRCPAVELAEPQAVS